MNRFGGKGYGREKRETIFEEILEKVLKRVYRLSDPKSSIHQAP